MHGDLRTEEQEVGSWKNYINDVMLDTNLNLEVAGNREREGRIEIESGKTASAI